MALLAAGLAWRHLQHLSRNPQLSQRRLTSFDPEMAVTSAAISTGSKFIAYANSSGLFVQVISSGDVHPLSLPAPRFQVSSISWFPDSAQLAVGGSSPGDATPSLWIVPVIGTGRPIELGPYPAGVVSPDGSEIAWVNNRAAGPELQLMGSGGWAVQTLVKGASDEVFGGVSWSPTGRKLSFTRYSWDPQLRGNSGSIDSYDLGSGKTVAVLAGHNFSGDAISLPDGRLIYSEFLGANPSAYGGELLGVHTDPRTGVATGVPSVIAKWNASLADPTVNASGTRLAVRDVVLQHSAYLGDLRDGRTKLVGVRRFNFGIGREDFPRAWTPDSQAVLLDSNRTGHWEIFKQALDSGSDEPFVAGPDDQFSPRLSPDGAWLLYLDRARNWREPQPVSMMRVRTSGGVPQAVLKASQFSEWGLRFECPHRAGLPCILAQRQGRQIVLRAFDPKVGFQNGSNELGRTEYVPHLHFDWCLAPDGSGIAWVKPDPTDDRIHLVPLAHTKNGLVSRGVERTVQVTGGGYLQAIAWSPDKNGWFVIRQFPQGWTLLYIGLEGRSSTLLNVASTFAPDVIPSPDGRHLAFSEQSLTSNVWLLKNF